MPPAGNAAAGGRVEGARPPIGREAQAGRQAALAVERIKQHSGPVQIKRRVKVMVPGKHFPQLSTAEQQTFYEGTAVEFTDRHPFPQFLRAWGNAHRGPGIRFITHSDAIDDPDHRGFWTTLSLWNKWRHETYKDNREAELIYLDELLEVPAVAFAPDAKVKPGVFNHFTLQTMTKHTYGGCGKMAGKTCDRGLYTCNKADCPRNSPSNPIPQNLPGSGQLFVHLSSCQPELAKRLRLTSKHSGVYLDSNGIEHQVYSFDELLPHHARFVRRCFKGFSHFYETTNKEDGGNPLLDWVRGFNEKAALPSNLVCKQLLEDFEDLQDERLDAIITKHIACYGKPCAGASTDIWSLKSCRQSYACFRGAFVLDGNMLAEDYGFQDLRGKLVDMCPLLGFDLFDENRHTGAVLARWKQSLMKRWNAEGAFSLLTEDGASNNKLSNKIIKIPQKVCVPHDLARCILTAAGETGQPCRNSELRAFTTRTSKMGASFSRSVVANADLQKAQLLSNPDLKPHQTLQPKAKNATRWLGLHSMFNRNRLLQHDICSALTGDANGWCEETAAPLVRPAPVDSSDEDSSQPPSSLDSEGDDQEEGNRACGKQFPLAHRCISTKDFNWCAVFESILDGPREATLFFQTNAEGFGEGCDLGLAYCTLAQLRDEAVAQRVELVSGRKESEMWTEVAAAGLPQPFQVFRQVFAEMLTSKFQIDVTPDEFTLLALKMNPSINTTLDGPQLRNKSAKAEIMHGVYVRALRRQARIRLTKHASVQPAAAEAGAEAPAHAEANDGSCAPPVTTPQPKRRRSLLGAVAGAQQVAPVTAVGDELDQSELDDMVKGEIDTFTLISSQTIAKVSAARAACHCMTACACVCMRVC